MHRARSHVQDPWLPWLKFGFGLVMGVTVFSQLPQESLLKETWFVARIVGAFAILAVYAWALFQKGTGMKLVIFSAQLLLELHLGLFKNMFFAYASL